MRQPFLNQRATFENDPRPALRVPLPIDVVQVQSTATTVFTADDDADFLITTLVVDNVSGGVATVTIHIVPSGGSATTANKIIDAHSIPANDEVVIFDSTRMMMLQPGASLVALTGTSDDVNIWGMGYRYQGVRE